jgi:hypothetical protein
MRLRSDHRNRVPLLRRLESRPGSVSGFVRVLGLVLALVLVLEVPAQGAERIGFGEAARRCLTDAYRRLTGAERAGTKVAEAGGRRTGASGPVGPAAEARGVPVAAEAVPTLTRPLAPGSPDGDLLPDRAPLPSAGNEQIGRGRRTWEQETSLLEARLREESPGADADLFMRVEGEPGQRLGLTRPQLEQTLASRRSLHGRIEAAAARAPRAFERGLSEAGGGYLLFDNTLGRLPENLAVVLRTAKQAMRDGGPEFTSHLGSYLKEVWDEALAMAIRSPDPRVRAAAMEGRIDERFFEQVLRIRVEQQGFPPVIRIEAPLDPLEFAKLQHSGAAFIDDVDSGIVKARAGGRALPELPTHGRLTHLMQLDYVAQILRRKGIPPERLREAIQRVSTNPRSGEVDPRGARSVWGYLFDQPTGSSSGLSVPDQMHRVLAEAWGLTR